MQAVPGCQASAQTVAEVTVSGGSAGPQTFWLLLDTGRRAHYCGFGGTLQGGPTPTPGQPPVNPTKSERKF